MALTVEIISYVCMFALALIFSVLSWNRHQENLKTVTLDWIVVVFDALSFIGWLVLAPLHLALVATESVFLSAPSILYFALAVLFLVFALKSVLYNLAAVHQTKYSVNTVE